MQWGIGQISQFYSYCLCIWCPHQEGPCRIIATPFREWFVYGMVKKFEDTPNLRWTCWQAKYTRYVWGIVWARPGLWKWNMKKIQNWNEHDKIDVWVYLKKTDLRELLGLEPVSLVIKEGRLRWFGHVEHEDDTDWIKRYTTKEVKWTKPKETSREDVVWWCQGGYEMFGLSWENAQSRRKWRRTIKRASVTWVHLEDGHWTGMYLLLLCVRQSGVSRRETWS